MAKLYESDIFAEKVDRLLAGEDIVSGAELNAELRSALDFASRLKALRPSPSLAFQANLKARLLVKINASAAAAKTGWFWRLVPREPVWQAAAVLLVIVIVGVALWSTHFRTGTSPIANLPTTPPVTTTTAMPTTTATATTTTASTTTLAPTTSATATTTSAPTSSTTTATTPAPTTTTGAYPAGNYLAVSASTDKSAYAAGQPVSIQVTLQNITNQPFTIEQYPPYLSLMQSPAKLPVYTFPDGTTPLTLAPGQTVTFDREWLQVDARGNSVSPGVYYVELEDIDYQGQALHLKLTQPVSFTIY